MSNLAIQPAAKASALAVMAGRYNVDPAKLLDTLKNTVFKGANDHQLMALVIVANEFGLNPLTKQIYAFPGKSGEIVPVVSVDGWLHIINSHPQMDGLDFEFANDESGKLESCTCVIHRKDRTRPVRVTEYLSECRRNTDPWKMEHRMLRHKALIQAGRIAFGFSGIVDEDDAAYLVEKHVTGTTVDVTPAPVAARSQLPTRPPRKPAVEQPAAAEPIPEPITKARTPLEELVDQCQSCDIDAAALIEFLQPVRNEGVAVTKLSHLTAEEVQNCLTNWAVIVENIGGRA